MEYSEILLGAEQVSGLLTLFRVADIADLSVWVSLLWAIFI